MQRQVCACGPSMVPRSGAESPPGRRSGRERCAAGPASPLRAVRNSPPQALRFAVRAPVRYQVFANVPARRAICPDAVMNDPNRGRRSAARLLQFLPVWLLLQASAAMPASVRARVWAALGGALARHVPGLRRRIDGNLAHAMPELGRRQRAELAAAVGRNAAMTLSELLFNRRFGRSLERFEVRPEGLEALVAARHAGCIVVSGHFGQWEAVRHVLRARGLACGAVYKPHANGYFNAVFRRNIGWGGEPLFESGPAGMRHLVRHLRKGGFVSLLLDQRHARGEALDFLGRPALTSTAAAELALRHGVPLVPAYGTRLPGGRILVEFEPPVEHTDAVDMTQRLNDSLSARVRANPDQWHWMHRRWKHAGRLAGHRPGRRRFRACRGRPRP